MDLEKQLHVWPCQFLVLFLYQVVQKGHLLYVIPPVNKRLTNSLHAKIELKYHQTAKEWVALEKEVITAGCLRAASFKFCCIPQVHEWVVFNVQLDELSYPTDFFISFIRPEWRLCVSLREFQKVVESLGNT
uniref:Uncharacterized protein n=1 Tax=Photinus pyralis TaxID=7054 RepID=A0A1Y1L3U9_PHOPY